MISVSRRVVLEKEPCEYCMGDGVDRKMGFPTKCYKCHGKGEVAKRIATVLIPTGELEMRKGMSQ